MPHLVLLGDSIFDNGAYTRGAPSVIEHLDRLLPAGWSATLLAADGSRAADIGRQLGRVPPGASHLVLAVGGNDALMNRDLLATRVRSTAETFDLFAQRLETFEQDYRRAVDQVMALGRSTTLCTVYNGHLAPDEARLARLALALFNDVIGRVAIERATNLIELRLVCFEPADYANPIEPSGAGGLKIARAIARVVGARGDRPATTAVGED